MLSGRGKEQLLIWRLNALPQNHSFLSKMSFGFLIFSLLIISSLLAEQKSSSLYTVVIRRMKEKAFNQLSAECECEFEWEWEWDREIGRNLQNVKRSQKSRKAWEKPREQQQRGAERFAAATTTATVTEWARRSSARKHTQPKRSRKTVFLLSVLRFAFGEFNSEV